VEDLFRGEKGLSPRFPRLTPAMAGGPQFEAHMEGSMQSNWRLKLLDSQLLVLSKLQQNQYDRMPTGGMMERPSKFQDAHHQRRLFILNN
jgi:hypothetical protein